MPLRNCYLDNVSFQALVAGYVFTLHTNVIEHIVERCFRGLQYLFGVYNCLHTLLPMKSRCQQALQCNNAQLLQTQLLQSHAQPAEWPTLHIMLMTPTHTHTLLHYKPKVSRLLFWLFATSDFSMTTSTSGAHKANWNMRAAYASTVW